MFLFIFPWLYFLVTSVVVQFMTNLTYDILIWGFFARILLHVQYSMTDIIDIYFWPPNLSNVNL